SPEGGRSDCRRQSGVGWRPRRQDTHARFAARPSPPPGPLARADLPPPGGGDPIISAGCYRLDAAASGMHITAMLRSALLNVMTAAARKAGRSLKRDYGEVENLQVSMKGPANFVTAADRRAEEILHTELTRARPGYGFLGEEGGRREGDDKSHCWIV